MTASEERGVLDRVKNDSPVQPPLKKIMKIDLLVNEKSQVWICHDKRFPHGLNWIEYDLDLGTLTFVCRDGKVHDYGELILPEVRTYLRNANSAYVVHMKNKKIEDMGVFKIVTRQLTH
jgi:hypothetical protein